MSSEETIFCGAHGCALKYCCLKENCISGVNKITKIFFEQKDRDEELTIYNQLNLNSIEGNEDMKYFIGDAVKCSIESTTILSKNLEKIASKLKITKDKLNELHKLFDGISYTDGGISLIKYVLGLNNINGYITLLNYLKNVFEGVNILHNNNGIYHLDLKPDNIVIGKVNGTETCRLIDFGDSFQSKLVNALKTNKSITKTKQKKILTNNRNELSNRLTNKDKIGTLEYMSPEMYILSHKTLRQEYGKKNTNKVNKLKNTFIEGKKSEVDNEYIEIAANYYTDIIKYIKSLEINFLKEHLEYSNIIKGIEKYYTQILTPQTVRIKYIKSDIWSLGIILVFIYSQIQKNIIDEKETEKKKLVLKNLESLILNLLIIDPDKRPNSIDSLKLYETMLSEIPHMNNVVINSKGGYKSKHNKTKHNKLKYNKTKYNKTKHNKSK